MILQALYEFYERSKDTLPVLGRELKEIGFLIVIDKDGNFLRFEDRRIDKKHAQRFLVTKQVGRTSAPVANYLYDNSAYVFGYSDKGDANSFQKYLDIFKDKVQAIYSAASDNEDLKAVNNFYKQDMAAVRTKMSEDPLWEEIVKNLNKKFSVFSFLIEGDSRIVAEKSGTFGFAQQ